MRNGILLFFIFLTLISAYVILVITGKLNINPVYQLNNTTQEHFIYSIGNILIPIIVILIIIGIVYHIIKR